MELKEWAEEREAARLEIAKDIEKVEILEYMEYKQPKKSLRLKQPNLDLQAIYENAKYNPRDYEELENYLRNKEAVIELYRIFYYG